MIVVNQENIKSFGAADDYTDEMADLCSDYESINDGESSETFNSKQGETGMTSDLPSTSNEYRILFLGKTVAGKTTLCKLLVAGGEEMARLRIEERIGQFLIVDDAGAIGQDGTSTTLAPTLIPCPQDSDLEDAARRVVLCDCPGFGDTRGWNAEVSQLQQVRQVALDAAALKVVLVVEHASIVAGTCVDSFVGLVEYAVSLLNNLDRYRSSVCLVINKVPATTRKVRGAAGKWQYELKQDEEFKLEARSFLEEVLVALRNGNRIAQQGRESLERCVKFVSDMLVDDRLALLRCPDEAVPVEDCELLQDSKKGVLALLRELQWVATRREDLGYPLSLSAGKEVSLRVQSLRQSIPQLMTIGVQALKEHYVSLLRGRGVEEGRALLEEHMRCPVEQTPGIPCETCFNDAHLAQLLQSVAKQMGELKNLQLVVDEDVVTGVERRVVEHKQTVHNFLKGWSNFLEFYEQLSDLVWSYDVQSRQSHFDVSDVVSWGRGRGQGQRGERAGAGGQITITAANVRNFVSVLQEQGLPVAPGLDEVEWSAPMLEQVNALLAEALRHKPRVRRVSAAGVKVEGICIVLSDVMDQIKDILEQGGPGVPRQITLLAGDTVFIDCDIEVPGSGGRLRLVVLAPRWEVTATCTFRLDGSPLLPRSGFGDWDWRRDPGHPGRDPGARGSDGAPGEPGNSAGAFMGACAELVNGHWLTISACGGRGGDGASGTPGANGYKGLDATPAFFSESRQSRMSDPSVVALIFYNQRFRTFYGFAGQPGGDGGDGGKGGAGGLPGEVVMLLPRNAALDVRSVTEKGKDGRPGAGGRGGEGGLHGRNLTGRLHFLFFLPVGVSTEASTEGSPRAIGGREGAPGRNSANMSMPQPAESFSLTDKRQLLEAYREMYTQPAGQHLPHRRRTVFSNFLKIVDDQLLGNVASRWLSGKH